MTRLQWDQVGERFYEAGVDRGVLYPLAGDGTYGPGVAWNGLVTVTEKPAGAAANPQYADNIKYLNLISTETFGGQIDAHTYPDEFAECDGTVLPHAGVSVGQQRRKVFGLCFRSKVGNDVDGVDHGYRLHLVWGAMAEPSDKAYATINDNPSAIAFSWNFTTTPLTVVGHDTLRPTSLIVIDSTKVAAADLTDLEDQLYGTSGGATPDALLPQPGAVIDAITTTGP